MNAEILGLADDQKTVRSRFIAQVSLGHPQIGDALKEIFNICTNQDRASRIAVYDRILDVYPFGSAEREKLMDSYAKIMDLERRVRKFHNAKVYNEKIENPRSTATADRFDYVFSRMQQENVEPAKVKEFFEENARAIFSLTMHPTNPTSMIYTVKGGIEFDKCLEDERDYGEHLKVIEELPLAGRKKTVEEEVEETIAILDMIYATCPLLRRELIEALDPFPAYREVIDVDVPLIEASTWAAGDGDGNENANIEALKEATKQLKDRIRQLYLEDIKKFKSIDQKKKKKKDIEEKLTQNLYSSPEELIVDLQSIPQTEELIYKIRTFGFHYAQIDIRHNSIDIMETLQHLLKVNHLSDDFSSLSLQEQKKFINLCLNDPSIIDRLKSTDEEQLKKSSSTAARVFGRLKLIPGDLDIFNKLIIAETSSIVNVLASLLLLKATGNIVAEPNTRLDIVTLSESVDDLQALPDLIEELISDPFYRRHLHYRGKLIPMIAKSDTVRRNGRGAEASQEEALGQLYFRVEAWKDKYPELKKISINGFSGGGAALQRGGGRVTEVPHNNGRAARFFGAKTIGPSLLTIQGHQMQILFSPTSIASHTLQSLVAQNIYARSQTELKPSGEHYVPPRRAPDGFDERKNLEAFRHACQQMREAYFSFMGTLDDDKDQQSGNQSFNQLFTNAPWVSVILGNLSSRPSKRGATSTNNDEVTARSLRGEKPKLLNNRAITVERVAAHSGTHFLNYLSVVEGFKGFSREDLHSMYLCSKSCRDFMRNTALSLHMVDFDLAWLTLIGQQRPQQSQIDHLAQQFQKDRLANNSNEQTLAWLQIYAFDVAKLVYQSLLNRDPQEQFTLETPLRTSFSNLAQQLTIREQTDEFGRYAEATMTNLINHDLDLVLGQRQSQTLQAAYAAADVVNAPEGGLNIELTRKQPL